MVVGSHVVVNLTAGPREANNLIRGKEYQMLFINIRRATYKNHKVLDLTTGSSRKPRMTNHDLHMATTTCHTVKDRALTPPSLPNQVLTIQKKTPKSARDGKLVHPRSLHARELRLEIRTTFGYRNFTYGFRKHTTCLFRPPPPQPATIFETR